MNLSLDEGSGLNWFEGSFLNKKQFYLMEFYDNMAYKLIQLLAARVNE